MTDALPWPGVGISPSASRRGPLINAARGLPALADGVITKRGRAAYIHNGRMAWELPRRIGKLMLAGAYLCPLGWQVVPAMPDASWEERDGYIRRRQLPPPVLDVQSRLKE